MQKIAFLALLISISSSLGLAQFDTPQQITYDRFLLPLATGEVAGAFGSLWRPEAVVHNGDMVARDFDADQYCISECPPRAIPPGQTGHVLFLGEPAANP